jgi:hypothetical protein
LEEYPNKNFKEVAMGIASKAKATFKKPAFLIGTSHPAADGEEILRGFEDVIGKDVIAFGGGAGDDYAFTETFVFTNYKVSNNGMVCIAFDEEKVAVSGIATCGWKAVGTEKTVTKSEGNHVFTIENEPALDITTKYGGLENVTPDNQDLLIEIAANFPLQLQRKMEIQSCVHRWSLTGQIALFTQAARFRKGQKSVFPYLLTGM